ncbi:hypothetical protein ACEWL9_003792 [Enterobacter hormaechei]
MLIAIHAFLTNLAGASLYQLELIYSLSAVEACIELYMLAMAALALKGKRR